MSRGWCVGPEILAISTILTVPFGWAVTDFSYSETDRGFGRAKRTNLKSRTSKLGVVMSLRVCSPRVVFRGQGKCCADVTPLPNALEVCSQSGEGL